MSSFEVWLANKEFDEAYPNASRIGDSTMHYNCHSYAWYSASTLNPYWMNDPSNYWKDGSYRQISEPSVNNKVTWWMDSTCNHSGIVRFRAVGPSRYLGQGFAYLDLIQIESKWGRGGLYIHGGLDSPYIVDNNLIKYYTR